MQTTGTQFSLRDLPLPAKLVVSTFLISVGLGYSWALMQLHFKHASKGSLAPTPEDVVERFSGQRAPWNKPPAEEVKAENGAKAEAKMVAGAKIKSIINARCVSCHEVEKDDVPLDKFTAIVKLLEDVPANGKLHKMISKDNDSISKDSMGGAFTVKSNDMIKDEEVGWKELIKMRPEADLRSERNTERQALLAWLEAGAPETYYTKDAFPLPEELRGSKFTEVYKTQAPEIAKDEKIAIRKKTPKDRQLTVEGLTQSTHAHLLTFSVLWACTGLVFAFSSYPLWMRAGLAPIVLIAQVADVCCWWLARMPGVGPYFALTIIGTGGVVGLGLAAQIVLSLFNMFGTKGKVIIQILLIVGGLSAGVVYTKYIAPLVAEEKQGG